MESGSDCLLSMAFFFAWSTTPGRSAQATEALDPTVLAGALTSSFRDEALQGSLATIRDLEGRYGARIEDIVVCGADGPIVLNRSSRDLRVVAG